MALGIGKSSVGTTGKYKCLIDASMNQAGFTILLRVTTKNFNGSRKEGDKETDFRASQYAQKNGRRISAL